MAKSQKVSEQYAGLDFASFAADAAEEVVTHAYVRDIALSSGRTLALITLDNGRDHTRPTTLGPAALLELNGVLDELTARAARGDLDAIAVTGKPYYLAAGADLSQIEKLVTREQAPRIAQLGH